MKEIKRILIKIDDFLLEVSIWTMRLVKIVLLCIILYIGAVYKMESERFNYCESRGQQLGYVDINLLMAARNNSPSLCIARDSSDRVVEFTAYAPHQVREASKPRTYTITPYHQYNR